MSASLLVRETCKWARTEKNYDPNYIAQIALALREGDDYWIRNGYSSRNELIGVYIDAILTRFYTITRPPITADDRVVMLKGLIEVGNRYNRRMMLVK